MPKIILALMVLICVMSPKAFALVEIEKSLLKSHYSLELAENLTENGAPTRWFELKAVRQTLVSVFVYLGAGYIKEKSDPVFSKVDFRDQYVGPSYQLVVPMTFHF